MQSYYYKLVKDRLYTKNGNEYPKFGVGGLRYRSKNSLSILSKLNVGEATMINNDVIKRVQ